MPVMRRPPAVLLACIVAVVALMSACSASDDDAADDGDDNTDSESHDSDSTGLETGVVVTLALSTDGPADVDAVVDVLEARLTAVGVDHRIDPVEDAADELAVWLAEDLGEERYDDLFTSPGRLEIRPVYSELPASDPACDSGEVPGPAPVDAADGVEGVYLDRAADPDWCYGLGGVPGDPALQGQVFVDASAATSVTSGSWAIDTVIAPALVDSWNAVADDCASLAATCPVGRIAIVVDDAVLVAPTVQPDVGTEVQIHGQFDDSEAEDLAAIIRGGILEVTVDVAAVTVCPC